MNLCTEEINTVFVNQTLFIHCKNIRRLCCLLTSISELRNVLSHCQTNLVNWYVNRFTDYKDSRAIILVGCRGVQSGSSLAERGISGDRLQDKFKLKSFEMPKNTAQYTRRLIINHIQ